MTTDLMPVPQLPIPLDAFNVRQSSDKVEFVLPDYAIARMSQDEWRYIRSFFDAAVDYARMAGYKTFSENRDHLRYSTTFTFWLD